MSNYNSSRQMVASDSLTKRIIAAAAGEDVMNPEQWTKDQIWFLANTVDWVDAWSYAKSTDTLDNNPDTGARPGVINDSMILSAVQTRIAWLKSLEPAPVPPLEPPADPIPS